MQAIVYRSVFFIGIFSVCVQIQAQNMPEPAILTMADTGAYSIRERSDWRRYNNGKYVGLVRHEVRASIIPKPLEEHNVASNGTLLYQGNFFVLENTLRDMRQNAQAVDAVIPVSFEIRGNGTIAIEDDRGFPAMRGFPTFPTQKVEPGFKWRAPGSRAVDPFNTGNPVVMPFTADYEYRGIEEYRNMYVHRIYAIYASQYQNRMPAADGFIRVNGIHKVDILIRVEDGLPIFMRDDMDETYTMADSSTVQFKGFTLTFGEGIVPLDRVDVIASLGSILNITIDLTPVREGIRLTVKDIRFVPDSAEFLPEERPRLDLIAEALKKIPDRNFLVEGHTAATGHPAEEMELSIERAKHMVDELTRRGINADRFIYKGWGSTRPVGDNSTNAGRSGNRRVEITILE
jgi:outer membrane protein OmpA-like peptidoglycan-associated protein